MVEGGLEQTEIDALAALKPELLRQIVRDAFSRYYDDTLDARAGELAEAWQAAAQNILDRSIDEDLITALHAEAEAKLAGISEEVERINDQLRASTEGLGVVLPPLPVPPEPELNEEGRLRPLIASGWPWLDQTRALLARKCYGNGEAGR